MSNRLRDDKKQHRTTASRLFEYFMGSEQPNENTNPLREIRSRPEPSHFTFGPRPQNEVHLNRVQQVCLQGLKMYKKINIIYPNFNEAKALIISTMKFNKHNQPRRTESKRPRRMMNFIKPQSEGAEYSPLASLLTSPLLSPLTSPTIAQPERIVTQSKDFELAMLQGIIMELDQAQLRKAVEKFYSRFCGNNLPAAAPLDLKSPVASPRMTQRVQQTEVVNKPVLVSPKEVVIKVEPLTVVFDEQPQEVIIVPNEPLTSRSKAQRTNIDTGEGEPEIQSMMTQQSVALQDLGPFEAQASQPLSEDQPPSFPSNQESQAPPECPIAPEPQPPIRSNPFLMASQVSVPQWGTYPPIVVQSPVPLAPQHNDLFQNQSTLVPQTEDQNIFSQDSTPMFKPQHQHTNMPTVPQFIQNVANEGCIHDLFAPTFQQQQQQYPPQNQYPTWQPTAQQQQMVHQHNHTANFCNNNTFNSQHQWNVPTHQQPPQQTYTSSTNYFQWQQKSEYPSFIETPIRPDVGNNQERNLSLMSFGPKPQESINLFVPTVNNVDQASKLFAPVHDSKPHSQPQDSYATLFSAPTTSGTTRPSINDSRMSTLRRNMHGDAHQRIA